MNLFFRNFGYTLIVLFGILPSVHSEVILDDDFEDGVLTERDLPRSLAYFGSQSRSSLTELNGKLTLDSKHHNRFIIAPLGEPGELIAIDDGETLSLEFKFQLKGGHAGPARQLRVAWLNSGLTPGSAPIYKGNGFPNEALLHSLFTGYQAAIRVYQPEYDRPIRIAKRSKSGADLIFNIGKESAYVDLDSGGSGSIQPETSNIMQFNLRRSGGTLEIDAIVQSEEESNGTLRQIFKRTVDADEPILRFDHIAIGLNVTSGSVDQIEIDRIRIFKVK